MSEFSEGYAVGRDSGTGNGAGMWGGDWAWWIVILLIFGWGGNGWGNNGGAMNGALTRGDLCQDMNFNNLESAVRGVQQGLCDGFYAMNTGMLTGFGNTQTAIMQNGYETRGAISDLGYRLQDCCCQTQRAIEGVNTNLYKSTCDITNAINGSTQQILGFLTQEKISSLQAQNAALTAQLSQNSQTQTIINSLRPVAQPAYITCSPYESIYGMGYNNRGNCGCNSCGM